MEIEIIAGRIRIAESTKSAYQSDGQHLICFSNTLDLLIVAFGHSLRVYNGVERLTEGLHVFRLQINPYPIGPLIADLNFLERIQGICMSCSGVFLGIMISGRVHVLDIRVAVDRRAVASLECRVEDGIPGELMAWSKADGNDTLLISHGNSLCTIDPNSRKVNHTETQEKISAIEWSPSSASTFLAASTNSITMFDVSTAAIKPKIRIENIVKGMFFISSWHFFPHRLTSLLPFRCEECLYQPFKLGRWRRSAVWISTRQQFK